MVEFVAILLALIVALSGLVYYQHHYIRILQTRIKWLAEYQLTKGESDEVQGV